MNKRLIAVLALLAIVGTGAFAQLALGFSGSLYSNAQNITGEEIKTTFDRFRAGDGIYYGPFFELGLGSLGLGVNMNFSFYEENWGMVDNPNPDAMMDYDISLYGQGHLFGYKAFLDPFAEIGFGFLAKDFRNSEDDPDPENPILASKYWFAGIGLGVNIGGLGVFAKGLYNFDLGEPVTGKYKVYDAYGNYLYDQEYPLASMPLSNLRFTIGAKLIL